MCFLMEIHVESIDSKKNIGILVSCVVNILIAEYHAWKQMHQRNMPFPSTTENTGPQFLC